MGLDNDLSIYLVHGTLKALGAHYKMIHASIFTYLRLNELGLWINGISL
jgi:hypothetical protein